MTRLLQISDSHFGTEREEVVEALVQLHAALVPEVVVFSGDLTQRATAAEFEAAKRFAERLGTLQAGTGPGGPVGAPAAPGVEGSRVFVLAGNHDIPLYAIWTRLAAPYRRYRHRFGSERGFEYGDEALAVIGVNSARHLNHKDGEIDRAQVEKVAAALERVPAGRLRIVVMHHPVHVTRPQNEPDVVHGGERAVRRWADAGVDLILGGHVHLPSLEPMNQRYAGLSRKVWSVQGGTATSTRTRGGVPNSVNVIEATRAGECTVDRYDFEAGSRSFVRITSDVLELQNANE